MWVLVKSDRLDEMLKGAILLCMILNTVTLHLSRVPTHPGQQEIPGKSIKLFKDPEIPWNLKTYMENRDKTLKTDRLNEIPS